MNPFRGQAPSVQRGPFRAELADPKVADGGAVTLRLYDPIDSYGGPWGVSAKEFAEVLDGLPDDTSEIRLLINSPGGEVWEGLAILNTLRAHPARVVAIVEGIAASAASFIAAGADELQVMKNAEIFVHKAWGLCVGNGDDMAKIAADLTHEDRNIASIYAAKSGGEVDEWLAVMAAETWYSAEEAVTAGLADRVIDPKANGGAESAKARFDLSVFGHARTPQATHIPPAEPPAENPTPQPEGADMTSDTLISGLRERLGINAEAELDDEGLLAAVDEALAEHAESTESASPPAGTILVDEATLASLQADAAAGRAARDQQMADHREQVVNAAVRAGRIPPARADHWRQQLAVDPGAEQVLTTLPAGLAVPLEPKGYTGGVDESSDDDRVYALAWGTDGSKGA